MEIGKAFKISIVVAIVIVLIVVGINFAMKSRDEGTNTALNNLASQCENALIEANEATLRQCDEELLAEMERNCDANVNYDICTNSRVETYYEVRADTQ